MDVCITGGKVLCDDAIEDVCVRIDAADGRIAAVGGENGAARPIRDRFTPAIAARLQALAWWDWPHERLRLALPDFRALSTEAFLDRYEARSDVPLLDQAAAG